MAIRAGTIESGEYPVPASAGRRKDQENVQFLRWSRRQAEAPVDLRWYNELQVKEIQRHKWIESEKAGKDLGQEAVMDWIQRHAADFRAAHLSGRKKQQNSWIERIFGPFR